MKHVLCYGDSNTWGADPVTGDRHDVDVRWTGVLQTHLGSAYRVIEEGLGGRTTVWDDPIEEHKNGKTYLPPCIGSHQPLDLVIIKLGTNDLKQRFSVSAYDIANSVGTLVRVIRAIDASLPVLILAPPELGTLNLDYQAMFAGGPEKSQQFPKEYRRVAKEYGCDFLDTNRVIVCSDADGLHYDAENHHKLGVAVADKVREIIG